MPWGQSKETLLDLQRPPKADAQAFTIPSRQQSHSYLQKGGSIAATIPRINASDTNPRKIIISLQV